MAVKSLNVIAKKATSNDGEKPPIVFIHGSWHGAWCWDEHFLDYFTDHGFDVYAPDLRGHGDSPADKAIHWIRAADYVEDVLSVVDGLDQKPILIGHSNGGFVAQHCMRKSNNIAGVGLMATVPHYGTLPVTLKVAKSRPIDFAMVNLTWSMYRLVEDPNEAKHLFLEDTVSAEDTLKFASELVEEPYWAYLDSVFLNLPGKYDGDLPALVVGAEKDSLFSVASQKSTAKRYGAECHIVKNAPHDIMLSSMWREAADLYIEWIEKIK